MSTAAQYTIYIYVYIQLIYIYIYIYRIKKGRVSDCFKQLVYEQSAFVVKALVTWNM